MTASNSPALATDPFLSPRTSASAAQNQLNLVPWPKSVKVAEGELVLSPASRIVFSEPALAPLAGVLSDEIYMVAGIRLQTEQSSANPGDIQISISPADRAESYTLQVSDRADVVGADYQGAAWGTVTLLQALRHDGERVALPRLTIHDHPDAPYRGLMIDIARNWISPDDFKQRVQLCRMYKIRYLQVHLIDNEAWAYTSKAFPALGSSSTRRTSLDEQPVKYTAEQLQELVQFSEDRGITLVPELEMPGHAEAYLRDMPELFKREHLDAIDILSEDVYAAIETLLAEIADIFKTSPYIHLGCEETEWGELDKVEGYQEFLEKHALKDENDLYIYFIQRVTQTVLKLGKRPVIWEWFKGDGSGSREGLKVPAETIVMSWTNKKNPPDNLINNGYSVINASWTPLYVCKPAGDNKWLPSTIYDWDMYKFSDVIGTLKINVEPTDKVLGGQMPIWETMAQYAIPHLRRRLATMGTKLWTIHSCMSYEQYAAMLDETDQRLEKIIRPVAISAAPVIDPGGDQQFLDKITMTLASDRPGIIRYTLDRSEPTPSSQAYAGPMELTARDAVDAHLVRQPKVIVVRSALFDENGKQIGNVSREDYYPVTPMMRYTLYDMRDGGWYSELPDYAAGAMNLCKQGFSDTLDLPVQDPFIYAAKIEAFLEVPESGHYKLTLNLPGIGRSNRQAARVFIHGKEVLFKDFGPQTSENTIHLERGRWPLVIHYATNGGAGDLELLAFREGQDTATNVQDWLAPHAEIRSLTQKTGCCRSRKGKESWLSSKRR